MTQGALPTESILGSESFRLLNARIDEKVAEVGSLNEMLLDAMQRIVAQGEFFPRHELRTRTFEER